MIDIHCHILPGLDDGPKSTQQSIALARLFQTNGYSGVVATTHYVKGTRWAYDRQMIISTVRNLSKALEDNQIGLIIYPGMEVALDPLPPINEGFLLGLNDSRYLLVELPFQDIPVGWDDTIIDMIDAGWQPILAHPERCPDLCQEHQTVAHLIDLGIGLQINWGSLLGHNGERALQFAWDLLNRGWVHCIASDSHDLTHRTPQVVQKGLKLLTGFLTHQDIQTLTVKNPQNIVNSQPLIALKPNKTGPKILTKKKKRWFTFLKRS